MIQVTAFYVTFSGSAHAYIIHGEVPGGESWPPREIFSSRYKKHPKIPENQTLQRLRMLPQMVAFHKWFDRLPDDSR